MTPLEFIALAVALIALGFAIAGFTLEVRGKRAKAAARTELAACNRPHAYADGTTVFENITRPNGAEILVTRHIDTDLVPPKPARGHAAIVVTRQEVLRAR